MTLDLKGGVARIVDERMLKVVGQDVEVLLRVGRDKTTQAACEVLHTPLEIIMIQCNQ